MSARIDENRELINTCVAEKFTCSGNKVSNRQTMPRVTWSPMYVATTSFLPPFMSFCWGYGKESWLWQWVSWYLFYMLDAYHWILPMALYYLRVAWLWGDRGLKKWAEFLVVGFRTTIRRPPCMVMLASRRVKPLRRGPNGKSSITICWIVLCVNHGANGFW